MEYGRKVINMLDNATINFVKGDTYSRDFTITGYDEEINEILFTVKNNESDKRYVLQKSLNNGITIVSDEDGVKTYNLTLEANESDDLKTNYDYYFAIKIFTEEESADIELTAIKGIMTLSARGD